MNIDINILNKIMANEIQQHIKKRSYTMIKLTSSQGYRDGSTDTNHEVQYSILTEAKTSIISIDAEKAFNKIQHPFMIKALMKLGIEGTYLNIIKAIYDKPTANIILNGGKLKPFLLKSGMGQGCLLSSLLLNSL
jgi:hypothetical protein